MSRKTGALNHTHRYYKSPYDERWHCMLDGCTHLLPGKRDMPIGYYSICWSCEEKFMITYLEPRQTKPMCDKCNEELEMIGEVTKKFMPLEIDEDPIMRRIRLAREAEQKKLKEKDQIEVIEPDEN
jgi:hypothetical protein